MAEIAVGAVVDLLVPFLVEEAKRLKGVCSSEIRSIKDEMEVIRVFLRDADAKAETDEQIKIWVRQVRQVAFRMEDVLDEFRLCFPHQSPHQPRFLGWIRKTFAHVKHLSSGRVITREIKSIKMKLHEISQQRDKYQLNQDAGSSSNKNTTSWQYRRDDALYVEESELVGIETHKNKLIGWLVEGEVKRTVFAVVGTGGVGKTTLVRKAYQSPMVLNHFDCRAWITVSQSFQMEQLLIRLITQFQESRNEPFPLGIGTMERPQLIESLREYLNAKRYVVILDDVWSVELWNSLKHALLENHCGSKILITTRMDEVAYSSVESSIHIFYHHPLTLEDALVLFYNKAFGSNFEGHYPLELEEISKKILKKCGGLPLAIVAIGGVLLMKEKTIFEWKKFYDNLSFKLEEDPNLKSIMKVISLSYNDLPCHLKSCFLYFCVFPEDHPPVISSGLLMLMWIAEGFVKKQKGKTLEEVAEDYLDQLINRNLVHVDHETPFFTHLRLCKVHDLMREFILSRCVDEDFCEVLDEQSVANLNENSRRLSIQNSVGRKDIMANISSSTSVRSIILFKSDKLFILLMHKLLSRFSLLKILVLSGSPMEKFPHEITKLYNLRVLCLIGTHLKVLPNSVGRLQNLEGLLIEGTNVVELPLAILKLKKLRHLVVCQIQKDPTSFSMFNPVMGTVKIPDEIGCLTSLQTLLFVDINTGTNLIKNLGKLSEMRILYVRNLRRENGSDLCTSIAKMHHLESLAVASLEENEALDLEFTSSPPSLLQVLNISGRLEKLPNWLTSLSNLLKINLNFSRLRGEPLKVLQELPNLVHISLMNNAYDGGELYVEAVGFQKLKVLVLSMLDSLQSLIIEEGAMPKLRELCIKKCEQLRVVPDGITHLMNLKVVSFHDMPKDFTRRLDQDGGEDYWKVKHVPALYLVN